MQQLGISRESNILMVLVKAILNLSPLLKRSLKMSLISPTKAIIRSLTGRLRHSLPLRVAALNTAKEILRTHRKPIELSNVVSLLFGWSDRD